MCEQTEKLIRDNQKMVTTIESATRGNNQDGDITINAMNNAIKALEEELERHKNQKEVHESAAHNSKVDWNRCSRECKQLRKQIKEKEKTLETMKGTKDITLEIGVPNFFYSDGSTIANLVSSNIIMVKHLNLRKGGFTLNDDDMKLLADSLLNNTYLTLIDLDGSNITKVGRIKFECLCYFQPFMYSQIGSFAIP